MSVDRDAVWDYVYDYLEGCGFDVDDYDVEEMVEEMADYMKANDIVSCDEFPRDIFYEMLDVYER